MTTIGERIKRRRIELKLTQEELASKMGYKSKSTINKIELGINDIPQSKIVQFSEVLDTTIAYLMDWDEEKKESDDSAGLTKNKQKLIDIVKNVPEDKTELVLRVLQSILED